MFKSNIYGNVINSVPNNYINETIRNLNFKHILNIVRVTGNTQFMILTHSKQHHRSFKHEEF